MIKPIIFTVFSLSLLLAEARPWRNQTGTQSFEADHISNDGKVVTLRKNGRIVTFAIEKLHPDDQAWILENHPAAKPSATDAPAPPKGAAFANLEFGDSRPEVLEKLKNSPAVDGEAAESMLTRTGLNGIYRTKQTIGGLHCHLYFDWTSSGLLREVTLRSKTLEGSSYGSSLKSNWRELSSLLTKLHGKAVQDGDYPSTDDLQDGLILCSHLWHTDEGHSVLLGTGQEGQKYSVVVRITSEHIQPVVTR
ncbi:MAG: hypothetical protein ACSHYF_13350 [Verrucomicrobiaceae bacterium]